MDNSAGNRATLVGAPQRSARFLNSTFTFSFSGGSSGVPKYSDPAEAAEALKDVQLNLEKSELKVMKYKRLFHQVNQKL